VRTRTASAIGNFMVFLSTIFTHPPAPGDCRPVSWAEDEAEPQLRGRETRE